MLSTCRALKNNKLLTDLVRRQGASVCCFHVYTQEKRPNVGFGKRWTKLQLPLTALSPNYLRFASSDSVTSSVKVTPEEAASSSVNDTSLLNLPDIPVPPPEVPVQELAAASLESIGLGGWTPVGIIQNCLNFIHVSLDIPWWGSIVIGTIIVRSLMFPLVIITQRNAAKMNNLMPQMQLIQLKMTDARERGDRLDSARYAQEMMEFMKVKGLNPFKNMLVPLAQAPLFISFFLALRGMSSLPVESMKTGGLFWFKDLTVSDEFYLLPLITSLTLAVTIEVGTEIGKLNSANMGLLKYFFRAMPFIVFPFTINFPGGVLVYWCSTNFISLIQAAILRIPTVRNYFQIPQLVRHDKQAMPIKDKGFVQGVKESWTNMKISRELEEREYIDKSNFTRAGRGAVKKTYKYDPTQRMPNTMVQAKKRD